MTRRGSALLKLAAEFKRLEDQRPSIGFAFVMTDSRLQRIVEQQVSLLNSAPDWLLCDTETGTEVALRPLMARALFEPELEWNKVERAIGLASPAPSFRAEVIAAAEYCVALQSGPRVRRGQLRKDWGEIAKLAGTAAAVIDKVRAKLGSLPGSTGEVADQIVGSAQARLDALALIARAQFSARTSRDQGGRPRMVEFNWLVMSLADAFERATGRAPGVNRNAGKAGYEGPFLVLVEAVLARLSRILREIGAPPIVEPSSTEARGKFILRALLGGQNPRG